MNKTVLLIALTLAVLFLMLHLVARIQMAAAMTLPSQDRRKGVALANRGLIEGAVCVGLFAFLLSRAVLGPLIQVAIVLLSLWLIFRCYRMTRLLILLQGMMGLRKRTAKGGGMNSGALAAMVSGAAGLIALLWAFIASQGG